MILPLSENGSPWIVGVPTIREGSLPKANETDNPFAQSADFIPTLNQRVGGGYSRVWAKAIGSWSTMQDSIHSPFSVSILTLKKWSGRNEKKS